MRELYAGLRWIEALSILYLQLQLHILIRQLLHFLLKLECLPLNNLLLELIGLVSLGNLVEEKFENRADKTR